MKVGLARLPDGVGWGHVAGAAQLAGIGFTVSLFVTELAFDDPGMITAAKLAILFASVGGRRARLPRCYALSEPDVRASPRA